MTKPTTLHEKIWQSHIVDQDRDGNCLIYIDRHLLHEVTSPVAFSSLRENGHRVRRPEATFAVVDHGVPSVPELRRGPVRDPHLGEQIESLERSADEFGFVHISADDARQGIVHIISAELGLTLPGMTVACGDSHTTSQGALGALGFGIGTSEIEHVLATQTLRLKTFRNMRIATRGVMPFGTTAKDMILHIIGKISSGGAVSHVVEFAGDAIRSLSIEGRMTICNMSVEAGARASLIAPDDVVYRYLKGRPHAPGGELFDQACEYWETLRSDPDCTFDKDLTVELNEIEPQVTWGTNPEHVTSVRGRVPDPNAVADAAKRASMQRALAYMDLTPGTPLTDIKIDRVFIGSCTNGQIEDIRAAALIANGRKVAPWVSAIVVPGSKLVKHKAEQEGLDKVFVDAGFEWREPSCSMCAGFNGDEVGRGQRCASTSNRNYEGRQGSGARTHLVSPAMAAAAAIAGHFIDVRTVLPTACSQ